jgi:hypothetical protein
MTIRLSVTVEDNDPEVETLMGYLNANCQGRNELERIDKQMYLLSRTLRWLEARVAFFNITPVSQVKTATASLSLMPTQTRLESHSSPSIHASESETPS